jgi:uncharacterized membrane protein
MNLFLLSILFLSFLFPSSLVNTSQSQSAKAVVHAVLFYSPTCGHCHLVITEVLPPLMDQYGEQLSIVGVDVSQPDGQVLFLAALQKFGLESGGVPFLVVGDTYLIGSVDIPDQFPGLIERYLAQGGVDWPAIPGLSDALALSPESPPATPSPIPEATDSPVLATPLPDLALYSSSKTGLAADSGMNEYLWTRFSHDLAGNSLALVVLAGMTVSMIGGVVFFRRTSGLSTPQKWTGVIPVLCIFGIGIAAYLAFVETSNVEAFCGPVGDCNTVQQSEYARIFGILPIGILGLVGYTMILFTWLISRFAKQPLASYASLVMLGLCAFGVLFSIYLTFLEPFVIGATCIWCLTSAAIMTVLLLSAIPSGKQAVNHLARNTIEQ